MPRVTPSHYLAMMRNMVTSLIRYEQIQTTHAKAKEAQKYADGMIALAKHGDLRAKQKASGFVREPAMVDKLFGVLGPRYQYRPGGFTRVLKLKNRLGDDAPISILEFVDRNDELRPATICTPEWFAQKQAMQRKHQLLQKQTRL